MELVFNRLRKIIGISSCFWKKMSLQYLILKTKLNISEVRDILGTKWWDFPVDTRRKLNVHKAFRKCPRRLMNVLYTFNLRPVSTGFLWTSAWHRLYIFLNSTQKHINLLWQFTQGFIVNCSSEKFSEQYSDSKII